MGCGTDRPSVWFVDAVLTPSTEGKLSFHFSDSSWITVLGYVGLLPSASPGRALKLTLEHAGNLFHFVPRERSETYESAMKVWLKGKCFKVAKTSATPCLERFLVAGKQSSPIGSDFSTLSSSTLFLEQLLISSEPTLWKVPPSELG